MIQNNANYYYRNKLYNFIIDNRIIVIVCPKFIANKTFSERIMKEENSLQNVKVLKEVY